MRERNENQMKGRWTRLNENANKWIATYKETYRQKRSGMSMADVEKEAHAIYEAGGKKFLDLVVFNQVMCKHVKWELKLDRDTTRSHSEYEVGCEDSGGSTKRSKTTEEDTDQESPNVGGSTIKRPTGRDAAKKKRKSYSSESVDEFDEWQSRVVEQNQQLDRMVEDMVINSSNMFIGDQPPRARRIYREMQREIGEARLMEDYFVDNPTYDDVIFRRRFRMRRPLFHRIVDAVTANDVYFQRRPDATGRQSLSPLQKCTGAMRVLAYGTSVDAVDEYLRMSGSTTREALMNFVNGVISCFGDEYLRKPTKDDLARLLYVGDQRGFPEARAPKVTYVVNGRENDRAYYLTDGIYPAWPAFVKSITSPQIQKHKLFAEHQEGVRKDVERAFGVLQARFAFLRHPCLVWDKENMGQIMIACIMLHNMIVKDERDTYLRYYDPTEFLNDMPTNRRGSAVEDDSQLPGFSVERIASLSSYMANWEQLRNREAHNALKNDLIEHIWQKFGPNN
ncbi:hypothetical protein OSB04_028164 [Centaurea solstitialis]|uniref:Transposase n=1 Tax=Centaurea solstitialis TaxID=347529 RepID=A0AA38T028_9ASTR|nr:hypothetical protein OSB04_028164 [Centaurea solstitialis]